MALRIAISRTEQTANPMFHGKYLKIFISEHDDFAHLAAAGSSMFGSSITIGGETFPAKTDPKPTREKFVADHHKIYMFVVLSEQKPL